MIHPVGDHFVISADQVWLPGAYATKEAAQYAFRFSSEALSRLQKMVNPGYITMEMLKSLKVQES